MEKISKILDEIVICLGCGGTVNYSGLDEGYGYFFCRQCGNIHLNYDHVWIFLPDSHEDVRLFSAFAEKYKSRMDRERAALFDQKLDRIKNNDKRSWEDEDVKHWDSDYKALQQKKDEEALDPGVYSRDIHLMKYIREGGFQNKILCEIGAGSAATVRKLLSPLDHPYYYVPTDYAYEALKLLQKSMGLRDNIQCIQCLGNRLPFRDGSIDYIFSLGVLHHMPKKEMHVDEIMPKLRPKGLFLLYEGYERGTLLSKLFFKYGKYLVEPRQSAHEERINRASLETVMAKYRIIHYQHEYSPCLTVFMAFYHRFRINSLFFIKTMLLIDWLVINSIGRVFKTFSSGACFAVLQK